MNLPGCPQEESKGVGSEKKPFSLCFLSRYLQWWGWKRTFPGQGLWINTKLDLSERDARL